MLDQRLRFTKIYQLKKIEFGRIISFFLKIFIIRVCLGAGIEHSDSPKVKCPFKDENYSCDMDLLEREIKAVCIK